VFTYVLNAQATVTLKIYSPGSGGTYGTLTQQASPGRNYLPFSGWLGRRALPPGAYEAELIAKNVVESNPPTTQTSRPVTLRFTVVPGSRRR
jgi:hypothetical protein